MKLKAGWLLYRYMHLMQFEMHKSLMRYKLNRISSDIKGTWLDIGAGDQPYKKYFASTDKYLTTNTKRHYSPEEVEQLEKLTTYWIEDGKSLPISDNTLDGVACFQVLSVVDKPEVFFEEISRVLKPGGKLILTTDFLYPVWSRESRFHHTALSLEKLSEMNGFEKIKTESFGGFGAMYYAVFMRFMRSFPGIWLKRKPLTKILQAIPYVIFLLLIPLLSIIGMLVYEIEKNNTESTDFTFNLLLTATKKSEG